MSVDCCIIDRQGKVIRYHGNGVVVVQFQGEDVQWNLRKDCVLNCTIGINKELRMGSEVRALPHKSCNDKSGTCVYKPGDEGKVVAFVDKGKVRIKWTSTGLDTECPIGLWSTLRTIIIVLPP